MQLFYPTCLWVLPSQSYNMPFGIPLSLPQYSEAGLILGGNPAKDKSHGPPLCWMACGGMLWCPEWYREAQMPIYLLPDLGRKIEEVMLCLVGCRGRCKGA